MHGLKQCDHICLPQGCLYHLYMLMLMALMLLALVTT